VFETNIVIVGNVLTAPEWRRTSKDALVANFRVASTSRRYDRDTGQWVDGHSLRVRVNCWRRLAEGVGASIVVGDPVVVVGRLFTRDWTDNEGNPRTTYEMEAVSVGHDLARGKARFFRNKPVLTSGVEADGMVRGEAAELVPEEEVPARYGEGIPEEEEPPLAGMPTSATIGSLDALPGGGFDPFDSPPSLPVTPEDELAALADDEVEIAVQALSADEDGARRPRRGSRRQPVPA
jgi:single-strand DNA-binding protein